MSKFGRSVPTYEKERKGPKPCTDPAKLMHLTGLHVNLQLNSVLGKPKLYFNMAEPLINKYF